MILLQTPSRTKVSRIDLLSELCGISVFIQPTMTRRKCGEKASSTYILLYCAAIRGPAPRVPHAINCVCEAPFVALSPLHLRLASTRSSLPPCTRRRPAPIRRTFYPCVCTQWMFSLAWRTGVVIVPHHQVCQHSSTMMITLTEARRHG